MAVLERELAYYRAEKDRLLSNHEGAYVLIADNKLLGAYTTEAEAYQAGIRQLGNRPFLIRRVTKEDEVAQLPALNVGVIDGSHSQ
jgi:hypothetical protein